MEFLSLHFPVSTEPASLTLLTLRMLIFFPSIHYLQAKTTSGTSACRTKKGDRLKLEKATHQFPEHYMFLLLSKFPTCTFQNSPAGREEKVPHTDSTMQNLFHFKITSKRIIRKITGTKLIRKFRVRIYHSSLNKRKVTYQ